MGNLETEIASLEEKLRLAELGPDAQFFEQHLADEVVMVSGDGAAITKSLVVEAHQPGKKPGFTRVEMNDVKIINHGTAAVVTCLGTYENSQGTFTLKF